MKMRHLSALLALSMLAACGSELEWTYPTPAIDLPESFDPARTRAWRDGRPSPTARPRRPWSGN